MPLDLQIIRAQEFIRMGGRGRIDFAASREALETLGAACRLRGIDRALLDVRQLKSDISTKELSTLVNMFREVGFPRGQRLALLHCSDQDQYRRARAFAFLSALRGWTVRAFNDFEQALEWLALDGPDTQTLEMGVEANVPVRGAVGGPSKGAGVASGNAKDKEANAFTPSINVVSTSKAHRKTKS